MMVSVQINNQTRKIRDTRVHYQRGRSGMWGENWGSRLRFI